MATIRKRKSRGATVYNVQVRVTGHPPISRTFPTLKLARQWAEGEETKIKYGVTIETSVSARKTLASPNLLELLQRYEDEVGLSTEAKRMVKRILGYDFLRAPIDEIERKTIREFREKELGIVHLSTLTKSINPLRKAVTYAKEHWGYEKLKCPFQGLEWSSNTNERSRILTDSERQALLQFLDSDPGGRKEGNRKFKNKSMKRILVVALYTAMRGGEILKIRTHHISADGETLFIPDTKTKTPRHTPLIPEVLDAIREEITEKDIKDGELVFNYRLQCVKRRFHTICKILGIVDFRFHDLRHTALSFWDQKGMGLAELKRIGGHKSIKSLNIYLNAGLRETRARMVAACS